MNKPSRHIDAAIELIDKLFPIENEANKLCWKCGKVPAAAGNKAGLCKQCNKNLRGDRD